MVKTQKMHITKTEKLGHHATPGYTKPKLISRIIAKTYEL